MEKLHVIDMPKSSILYGQSPDWASAWSGITVPSASDTSKQELLQCMYTLVSNLPITAQVAVESFGQIWGRLPQY